MWGEPGFVFVDHEDSLFNPCVSGKSEIITNKGKMKVEDLTHVKEDLFVLCMNHTTGKLEYQQILHFEKTRENTEVIEIETEDGNKTTLTPDHQVYVEGKGYIKASELKEDDVLISI
jgi:intein/homing endonuclease